jgi:regulator of sigma E protease
LPIGGFCKLYGEDGDKKGGQAFNNKNPWQKMLIVLGGVSMNLVLAIVIFSVVYAILGVPKETNKVMINGVVKNSPAEKAGLKEYDVILKVESKEIKSPNDLTEEVGRYKGKTVKLEVVGKGLVDVEVRENPPEGEGSMGISISNMEMVKVPWYRFYEGIGAGFKEAYYWGKIIISGVLSMIGGLFQGNVPKDVRGPIGMYEVTSSIKQSQGILAVIHFFGMISVDLAVLNVLPFPALDGGRIIFVLYEMIFKKRANEKLEIIVNNIGMMILLGLILLITIGDIKRVFAN